MSQPSRGVIRSLPSISEVRLSDDPITVLQVDDDSDFCDFIADRLRDHTDTIEIESETDPTRALRKFRSDEVAFDCVVSDYQMPGPDGLELLEAIRETDPDVPFILFTGKGNEEIASEAISAGVSDYLQKDSSGDLFVILANRIENLVAKYRSEHRVHQILQALERSREGISLIDQNGRFVYVNPRYAEIVGYQQRQLIGEPWDVLYPDGAAEEVRENILPEVTQTGRWEGYTNFVTNDGATVLVEHGLSYTDDRELVCLIRPAESS